MGLITKTKCDNKKPVAQLEGAELDYWVAMAQGWHMGKAAGGACDAWRDENNELKGTVPASAYQPSTNWGHGGLIIECDKLAPTWMGDQWEIEPRFGEIYCGNTFLVVAMRAFVASKFGEYVEDIKRG